MAAPAWRKVRRFIVLIQVTNVACSCEEVFHHVAVDIGQAKVAALVATGQLLVVDSGWVEAGAWESCTRTSFSAIPNPNSSVLP